jgi:sigma-B regulation protein RsbU (phosphoserine phosphatase)
VIEHKDDQTVIAMGDVSGKGAAAALYGALVAGLLRTMAPRRRNPAELMRALNDVLIERKVEARYVTLGVLLWDPATRKILMANAGAIPPMICRGGEILKVKAEGVPIGLLENTTYEEVTVQTEPGDLVVLYSDGIPDHMSPAGQEFGRGRLAQIVRTHCNMPPDDLIVRIFAEMDKFNPVAFDDQSIFVMKVK